MNAPSVEPLWRWAFRCGIAPAMSTEALSALRHALVIDDPALIQGAIVLSRDGAPCQGCAISLAGMRGHQLPTALDVQNYFLTVASGADERLGPFASCGWFLHWWDDTPRAVVVPALLALVEEILEQRVMAG